MKYELCLTEVPGRNDLNIQFNMDLIQFYHSVSYKTFMQEKTIGQSKELQMRGTICLLSLYVQLVRDSRPKCVVKNFHFKSELHVTMTYKCIVHYRKNI